MIKKITTVLVFFLTLSISGQQEKINNYKYVIVLDKFHFLKTPDKYQTSSLTKFLLKKKGFNVFLSNESLPNELVNNKCFAVLAEVIDDSGLFTVKNKIQFKDCYGTVLYTSQVGKSKEKDYKKAYHEAIRKAFDSMLDLKYSYEPLAEEIKNETTIEKVVVPVTTDVPVRITNSEKEVKKAKENANKLPSELTIPKNTLYAQAIKNGFQLVNLKPEVVFQVLNTKVKDVYIIKDKNGILYKNVNVWVAEFYSNNKLIVERYQIKF